MPQYKSLFGSFDQDVDHKRRYDRLGLRALLAKAGYEVDICKSLNWLAIPGWYLNGVLLKRKRFSKVQLKIFDSLVWLLRLTDWLPLPGLSILVVAHKRP